MNTYFFTINSVDAHVEKDGLQNVIYNVHYSYVAQDSNQNVVRDIGVIEISEPNSESFTPFEQLTQDDVIGWIEPLLDVSAMQERLDQQLSEMATPTKVTLQLPVQLEPSPEAGN